MTALAVAAAECTTHGVTIGSGIAIAAVCLAVAYVWGKMIG